MRNILVIDDDEIIQNVLEKILVKRVLESNSLKTGKKVSPNLTWLSMIW